MAAAEAVSQNAILSIRVSPHNYFATLFVGSFLSALLFYLQLDAAAIVLFVLSWIVVPFLALNDRVAFDGKRLYRTGLLSRFAAWFSSSRKRLRLSDVETVETDAIRALKRGNTVYYRYRTVFRGRGLSISLASGGEEYRRMIRAVLSRLPENVLDNRSLEIRDHLADPKETIMRAEFARIPSSDVLEASFKTGFNKRFSKPAKLIDPSETDADDLQSLGNELRLSGYLVQAVEAFRRALVLRPRDARLIFDFARCLYALANVERNPRLERRALAALRLAEGRAAADGELLVRLGEWHFQIGNWRRAGSIFENVIDRCGENFRAIRGLAEIALREGKIAHVIHHFAAATRTAETSSLRRWTESEAKYFANLQADDEYMELEISRVNMLETVERSRKTTLRIMMFSLPFIVAGVLLEDELIANIGWAVSAVSIFIWAGLTISTRMLIHRLPYELVERED